jgi:alpha-N-arabinofuranosidase
MVGGGIRDLVTYPIEMRSLAARIAVVLAWCVAAGSATTTPASASDALTAVVTVNAGVQIRRIPRTLYGTNVEWFQNGNGIVDGAGSLRPDLVHAAKDGGVSLVRFPGGTFSDYYHWRDGTGPIAERPITKDFTDPGSSKNVMGSPEITRFARATGGELLITVNAGTGTPAEAAQWVAYFNAAGNQRRKADGFERPVGVHYWEVGNELYYPGNPGELQVGVTPEVYASRFAAFAHAMKAVDRHIALIAISSANATRVALPYPEWLDVLLKADARDVDLVAVHNAYFPILFEQRDYTDAEVYSALWAAPEAIDRDLTRVENTIGRYDAGRDIGIAVTEWGLLFTPRLDPRWIDHVKTLGSAIYAGRVLQVLIAHPKVRVANFFKLTDATPMGWIGYDGVPKAPYYALQLFSRHFGSRLVQSKTAGSQTYDVPGIGVMPAETKVAEVTAIASLDDTGRRLFVNLLNRSASRTYEVSLDICGFRPKKGLAKAWKLSAPRITDNNGPDVSPELSRAVNVEEPSGSVEPAHSVKLESRAFDPRRPIQLAPFSLVTVEMSRE